MTEISVIAERVGTVHNVPIQLGMDYFDAKFDTGSSATVIAASVFFEGWSEKAINMLETLCSQKFLMDRKKVSFLLVVLSFVIVFAVLF